MVERPIKKSERQSEDSADTGPSSSDFKPPVQRTSKGVERGDKRSSGKGKKASEADESKQVMNPALVRGPKPVKTQAVVTPKPEAEPELLSDEPQDEATEG